MCMYLVIFFVFFFFFFFFSSRRRHTRWNCDWSSDVCSSDLMWPAIEFDVAAALGTWVGAVGDKSLWVACRFDPSRLHVARVRSDVPAPPPAGIERRSPERLVLELAGLSLGALERIWAVADQATGYLCGALALLDACFERVRRVESLTPSARAHLLADLAVVEDAIEGALDAA